MSKLKTYITLFIIIIVATTLRLYHNTEISLWHDEAFSGLLIKYPWSEMMYRIGLDVHPPMYYIALRGWAYIFGDSLLALRGFSVFFGVTTVLAAYAFVKTAFKSNAAALIASLLIAINPFQIQYATEARMYTFGAFFALLAAYFLVKALQTKEDGLPAIASATVGRIKQEYLYFVFFALSISVTILTHYYLLFIAVALCFYALCYHIYYYQRNIKPYIPLLLSFVIVIVSFLPWVKIFIFQYKQVGSGYWIPPMDKWSIPTTLWQILIGIEKDINQYSTQVWVTLATAFTIFLMYRFLKKTNSPHKWLALLAFLAPFAGAILFLILAKLKGQESSVYLVRYFLFSSAFLSIMIAVWLTTLKAKWLTCLLLTAYCLLNFFAFSRYWHKLDIGSKLGMNKAALFIQNNVSAVDKLYVGSSFEFFNLKYYIHEADNSPDDILNRYSRRSKVYEPPRMPIPKLFSNGNTSIKNLPHFAGTAILTDQDLLPDFNKEVTPGGTVWLLWTNGFGGSKPETPKSWEQLGEWSFAEVRPYVGTWIIITQYQVK